MTYKDFSEAAKQSSIQKAISQPIRAKLKGRTDWIFIRIVKPLHGDAYAVYNTAPGIRVANYKVSTREVDDIKNWESF